MRETLHPATRSDWLALRGNDVTSTEVSALFGSSKYFTAYELALVKTGEIDDQFKDNERSDWGSRFEEAIARGVGEVYGVAVRRKAEYMRLPEIRMGASFDFEITGIDPQSDGDDILRRMYETHGPGLLEIKNVDYFIFRDEWLAGAEPEAPAHIEIQVQQQLHVSGFAWACIAALVGGNKLHLIIRFRDGLVCERLAERVRSFWVDLDAGVYPPVVYPDDNEIIRELHSFAEPGSTLDATGRNAPDGLLDLIERYNQCSRIYYKVKDQRDTARAKLLQMIGAVERVKTDIAVISCKSVPEKRVRMTRKAFRQFKVYPKVAAWAASSKERRV